MRVLASITVVLSVLMLGCDSGKVTELENKNKDLASQLVTKDKYIEEVTSTMNEIHDQLESAWWRRRSGAQPSSPRRAWASLRATPAPHRFFSG